MEYRRFGNTIIARIDRGEEVLEQVKAIAQAEQIKLASVQALGAVGEFTVGVFHTAEKQYHANSFAGDFEIVSLTGTISPGSTSAEKLLRKNGVSPSAPIFASISSAVTVRFCAVSQINSPLASNDFPPASILTKSGFPISAFTETSAPSFFSGFPYVFSPYTVSGLFTAKRSLPPVKYASV